MQAATAIEATVALPITSCGSAALPANLNVLTFSDLQAKRRHRLHRRVDQGAWVAERRIAELGGCAQSSQGTGKRGWVLIGRTSFCSGRCIRGLVGELAPTVVPFTQARQQGATADGTVTCPHPDHDSLPCPLSLSPSSWLSTWLPRLLFVPLQVTDSCEIRYGFPS